MKNSPRIKSLSVKPPQAMAVRAPMDMPVKPPQMTLTPRPLSVKPPQANFVRSPQARSVKPPQANSVKPPQFAGQKRVVLAGSEKSAAPNSVRLKATPPKSKVTVSVIVKRKEPLKINQRGRPRERTCSREPRLVQETPLRRPLGDDAD